MAAAAATAVIGSATALAVGDSTILVSRADGPGGAVSTDASSLPSISGDGCRVAFQSGGNELSGADDDSVTNVYVRDVCTAETILASLGTSGAANSDATQPALSDDGCHVVFTTGSDLNGEIPNFEPDGVTPNPVNTDPKVYERDVCTDETILVSRRTHPPGASPGDPRTGHSPSVSADGNEVVFTSAKIGQTEDAENDNTDFDDVFLRDIAAKTTELVSETAAGGAAGNQASDTNVGAGSAHLISDDGRWVLFRSAATDLVSGDTNGVVDLFVRDMQPSGGPPTEPPPVRVSLTDAEGQLTSGVLDFGLSGDGLSAAFSTAATELGSGTQVYLRDIDGASTELVSRASGATGDAGDAVSGAPGLSDDGTQVAFASSATNLVAGISGPQVYARDTTADATALVSRADGASGAASNGSVTGSPSVDDDADAIAFGSNAGNLSTYDVDPVLDVFRRDASAPAEPPPPPPTETTGQQLVTGVNANIEPLSGNCSTRQPGERGFIPLSQRKFVPLGTVVNARRCLVRVTTTFGVNTGQTQTGDFANGLFQIKQSFKNGMAFVILKGKLRPCEPGLGHGGATETNRSLNTTAQAATHYGRRLWGSARRRWRLRGYRSAGTLRGTVISVVDRCKGVTVIKNKTRDDNSKINVNDFYKPGKVNKVLKPGQRYTARPQ